MSRRLLRAHLRRVGVSTAMMVAAAAAVIPAVAQEAPGPSPGCQASDNSREDPTGVARDDCVEQPPEPEQPEEPEEPVTSPAPSADTAVLSEQSIQRGGQVITVSAPEGSTGTIELDFGDEVDEAIDASLSLACDALTEQADAQPLRLAPNVFVVVPSDFGDDDEVVVTTTVPASLVRQGPSTFEGAATGDWEVGSVPGDASFDTPELLAQRLSDIRSNRDLPGDPSSDEIWVARFLAGTHVVGDARTAISAKATYWSPDAFGICFAGDKADPGALSGLPSFLTDTDTDTGLFGPVLLPTCTDSGAPCVDQRTATADGTVELVTRIPAKDPWMR